MTTTELRRQSEEFGQRLARLECEVGELKELMTQSWAKPHRKAWLRTVGIFKDDPGFQEIVRLGREYRESQPYPEDP